MIKRPVDPVEVTDLVTDLQRLAARLDPDAIPDRAVAGMLTDLGQATRLVDGMVTLLARRTYDTTGNVGTAATAKARRQVADATGTTPAAAKKLLDTSIRLRDNDQVAAAVRDGLLSGDQAEAVADAAGAAPGQTGELLDAAARQSVQDLRKTCRDTKAAADPDPAATRRRHHRTRHFRGWSESDGEWKGYLSGPADAGARIEAAIRGAHDQIFKTAHAAGRQEDDGAYRFDALLDVLEANQAPATDDATTPDNATEDDAATPYDSAATEDDATADNDTTDTDSDTDADIDADTPRTPAGQETAGGGPGGGGSGHSAGNPVRSSGGSVASASARSRSGRGSGRQTKVIVNIDADALRRGYALAGETCEIAGLGRVPVEAVKELIPDAHIAYVIANAVDAAVVHLGRQITAHQRTAMEARGYECEVPDCRSSHLLEIDHVIDWAISKETKLDQLAWLCRPHHRHKSQGTHRLTGPPGGRHWTQTSGHSPVQTAAQEPAQEPAQQRPSARTIAMRSRIYSALRPNQADADDNMIGRFNGQAVRGCGNPPQPTSPTGRHRQEPIEDAGWTTVAASAT